jgi:hypothetical protein
MWFSMVLTVESGDNWLLGQSPEVVCGSVRVWEFSYEYLKKLKSTPSRVGLDEVGLDFGIGGLDMISGIEYVCFDMW